MVTVIRHNYNVHVISHVVFCNSSLKSAVSITIACLNVCALKITGAMGMENIYLVMYHDTIKFNIHSLHNEISYDFHLSKKINHTYVSQLHCNI